MPEESLSDVTIGPWRPGDEHEILKVFNRVFKQDRRLEMWAWQFGDNPEGVHCFLARFPSGRVLSQFTGIPRRMKVRQKTACFAEIVDSLTDPEFRQGLKKPGLFASTCLAYVDHFGRPDREVIMYGLPNPPAYRVGQALLGYVHLYHVLLMTAPAADAPPGADTLPGGGRSLRVDRFSAAVDVLQVTAGSFHEVMTVRDARYLNWRYAARPDAPYALHEFRDGTGHLFGIAVLRHRWLGQPLTACAELFCERHHPQIADAARRVRELARAAGDERVQAFVRPDSPEWLGLGQFGWAPEPSHFRLVARTYDADGVPLDWLKDAWYVSLGDFDVV